jgi:hypothetical protein
MTRRSRLAVLVALVLAAPIAHAHEHQSAAAANPSWDKLKTLVGAWEGTYREGGTEMPSKSSFRLVSANSTLMHVLGEGSPAEMITMFHMDLNDLMATHYCAGHNQPRFKAVPAKQANQIAFEFKDGTNIAPGAGHMQRVIFTFVDADHHQEDWVYLDKGKESNAHFEFHRAK